MTHMGSDTLQARWNEGWLPMINGIVLSTGTIRRLHVPHIAFNGSDVQIWAVHETSPEINMKWVRVSECFELINYRSDICIGCGETSLEGEGFLVVTDMSTQQLRWAAILRNIGPFISAACIDGLVWVVNESNEWVGFDVEDPRTIYSVSQRTLGLVPGREVLKL